MAGLKKISVVPLAMRKGAVMPLSTRDWRAMARLEMLERM
jgi:hypothetical protein